MPRAAKTLQYPIFPAANILTFFRERLERIGADRHIALLASGSVVNGLVSGAGFVLWLASSALLARISGTQEYGVFVIAFTWLTILALVAGLGVDQTLLRLVAAYRVREAFGALAGLLAWGQRLVWLSGTGAALVTALAVWLAGDRLDPGLQRTLWLVCLALPLAGQINLRLQALRSLRRYALGLIPEKLFKPLIFMGAIWMLHHSGIAVGGAQAMTALLIATLLSLLLLSHWLRIGLPPETFTAVPERNHREWLRLSLPLLVVSGMNMLLSNTDIVMLGIFAGAREAGIYSAASRIANVIAFGLVMVNSIAAPLFSELHAANKLGGLQRLISFAAAGTTLLVLLAGAAISLFGRELLQLFGPEFAAGYHALLVLCVGQLVNAWCGSVGYLLSMTGHQNTAARILTLSAVINIVGNAMLIPRYGIVGAAITTAATTMIWNLAMVVEVRRRLDLHPTVCSVFPSRATSREN